MVIVGAGSAGCVVARRLSELSPKSKVLLIEAGHTFGVASKVPLLSVYSQGGKNDWKFKSTPQKHSSKGMYNSVNILLFHKNLLTIKVNFRFNFSPEEKDLAEHLK